MSFGRVVKARLLSGQKNHTLWLYNQTTPEKCVCAALQYYSFSDIAVLSPSITYNVTSNVLLLQPLTDSPCCSDLSWLLERIQKHTFTLPSGYTCANVIYRQGHIFVGCDTPPALMIFNETNLSTPVARINMRKWMRVISFACNDTLMFVAVQEGSDGVYIYNINWTSKISTLLVTRFSLIVDQICTLTTGVANMLLLDNYELFVTDCDQNFVYRFEPNFHHTL
ncbi:hypothetical protein I4U23_003614 [Adineta vaga]|nr:hypothetical protein I4U23_003614 [Adineta vaga]